MLESDLEALKRLPAGFLLRCCIEEYVKENPITDDDKLDLNPHLQVEAAAGKIAVRANSLLGPDQPMFTVFDVVLAWLTRQLHG